MSEPRIIVSVFDIFSPVRLEMNINGRDDIGVYPAGTNINFVFDARLRFLVPRSTLEATSVLVSLADPHSGVLQYRSKCVKESAYVFSYFAQSLTNSILGAYTASVYVWREADILYPFQVHYITEPFVAFVLE